MLRTYIHSLRYGLLSSLRRPVDLSSPLIFFVMVTSLFPLGIGPEKALLLRIAPGIVWAGALLASLLALQRLFEPDLTDGTLEQMLLSPEPFVVLVAGKISAHWMTSGVPLAIVAPVVALQYGLDGPALGTLLLGALLGTLVFSTIGSIGAALGLGSRGGSLLTALLVMPLQIPVVILGSGALTASLTGVQPAPYLMLLGALACAALALAPWATAAALRLSQE
ncbi:MAG: heme exporter protein CcmB [Pseudomonadota bacterium]